MQRQLCRTHRAASEVLLPVCTGRLTVGSTAWKADVPISCIWLWWFLIMPKLWQCPSLEWLLILFCWTTYTTCFGHVIHCHVKSMKYSFVCLIVWRTIALMDAVFFLIRYSQAHRRKKKKKEICIVISPCCLISVRHGLSQHCLQSQRISYTSSSS